ncbi:putative NOD3 protein [Paratrimastix pyriformis]|uniref:NOD3 protein n=1 Tax=Paratrimastix pyriformis TaxID=342808 RepID=A0ABQ8UNN8_9EUKA|nr:putative NOD3 protein [Paratrimastix pyriformis]
MAEQSADDAEIKEIKSRVAAAAQMIDHLLSQTRPSEMTTGVGEAFDWLLAELPNTAGLLGDVDRHALEAAIQRKAPFFVLRGQNDTSLRGQVALARVLRSHPTIRHVRLYGNALGDAGAAALSEGLREGSLLEYIGLNCNHIGPVGAILVAEALQQNAALTELELGDNPIGDAGVAAIAGALPATRIRSVRSPPMSCSSPGLNLENVGMSGAGAASLASALARAAALTSVRLLVSFSLGPQLFLDGNPLGPPGMEALARHLNMSSLVKLNLSGSQIGPTGARSLAAALRDNTQLETLFLCDDQLGDAGAAEMGDCLAGNKGLRQSLDLRDNSTLGPAGTATLADALPRNTALHSLGLVGANPGAEGAAGLAAALTRNVTLQRVSLDGLLLAEVLVLAAALRQNPTVQVHFRFDQFNPEDLDTFIDRVGDAEILLRMGIALHDHDEG